MNNRLKKYLSIWKKRILPGYLRKLTDLSAGTDTEGTINTIKSNADIRGANFWILLCGAILASVGLDVNSAAVIIGAMLISPLMSPILGIGLGIGINDKALLLYSLKNFGIAVILSITTSVVYFLISPLSEVTPEIVARTSPTILDIGVAFFGGVAGMVAGSRKDKTNAIPGVAIATALMPPLCTSGFGIAKGNSAVFLGAFYLFFLNAVFISLSTYIVIRLLRFPQVEAVNRQVQLRIHRWITVFVLIIMIPSAVIFYSVINEIRIKKTIDNFLSKQVENPNTDVLRWESVTLGSVKQVKVFTAGEKISPEKAKRIEKEFEKLLPEFSSINLVHLNLTEEERRQIATEAASSVMSTITFNQNLLEKQQQRIDSLAAYVEKKKSDSLLAVKVGNELRALFPQIKSLRFEENLGMAGGNGGKTDSSKTASALVYVLHEPKGFISSSARSKIRSFIEERLQLSVKEVYFIPAVAGILY